MIMRRLLLASLAIAVGTASCGGPRSRARAEAERAVVEVENRAFSDMTVYVVEGAGARRRLGLATGASTTTFTIPSSVVGLGRELQFIVDPIGSTRTAITNSLFVTPGQRVRMVIPPG